MRGVLKLYLIQVQGVLKKTHDERDGAAKLVERAESLMEKLSAQVLYEKD